MNGVEITVLVLSFVDAVCCLVCRVPQVVRLYRLKESNAISVPFWVFSILSCFMCITAFSLKLFVLGEMSTIVFLISASMNLILNLTILFLTILYRKNKKEVVKQEQ